MILFKKICLMFFVLLIMIGYFCVKTVDADEYENDLAVESITVSPETPAVNQDCIITIKIKNNGTNNLYSTFGLTTYNYNFDNFSKTKLTSPFPSLGNPVLSGQYFYYTFAGYFTKEGESVLSFIIDVNNDMGEGDEDNNLISKTINIIKADQIDILVEKIELSENKPIINIDVTITVTIKNNDSVSLINSAGLTANDILISFSGFTIESKVYDSYPTEESPLKPGEEFKYVYNGKFYKHGENSINFKIDKNNRVIETNENNNATSTTVTVYLTEEARDDFNITSTTLHYISSSSVMVKWNTDIKTTGRVNYKEHIYESFEEAVEVSESLTEHQATIENLKSNTVYYYRVVSVNGIITKNTSYYNFTTPYNDELKVTVNPAIEVDNSEKIAAVSWTTNLLASSHIYYRLKGAAEYNKVGSDSLNESHAVSTESMEAGEYEYYVESISSPGTIYKSAVASFVIQSTASNDQGDDGNGDDDEGQDEDPGQPDVADEISEKIAITNENLYNSLKGKIILTVEANGEAYYVNPGSKEMYYLGRPDDAFSVMRSQGIGITNNDLEKIQVGLNNLTGNDADNDGLPDMFEDAIGTDKNKKDTDGDGHEDKAELESLYNPKGSGSLKLNNSFADSQKGKIFLQVENNGEAWYVNPADNKRYFLGRPADAFSVMRNLGLGISNSNFDSL